MRVLVAIPCYNCEKQIGRVIAGFDQKLLDRVEKVMVIDNISTDGTREAAKAAAAKLGSGKVQIIRNDDNYGLGGSHKVAFLQGEIMKADYVAILHGDDQAKAQELNLLLDMADKHPEAGAILGSRFMPGSTLIGYAWQRIWGNRVINLLFSIVTLQPSRDLGSGLNLFRLKDLSDHNYLKFGDNITFNIDLLLDYFKKHTKLVFVPITWIEKDQVSNARNFKVGSAAVTKLLRWRIGREDWLNYKPKNYTSTHVS